MLRTVLSFPALAAALPTPALHAQVCTEPAPALTALENPRNTVIRLCTAYGAIDLEMFDAQAPVTVANFLAYLDRFDDSGGTIFHRSDIQDSFKILQAGGYTFNDNTNTINSHITTDPTVRAEVSADRQNLRGTLGAARTSAIDSATGEFFFNLDDVNAKAFDVTNGGGYTVFGRVAKGMEVVDSLQPGDRIDRIEIWDGR